MNGLEMPDEIFKHASDNKESQNERSFMSKLKEINFKKSNKQKGHNTARYTILDLLKNRRLTMYAFIMSILW